MTDNVTIDNCVFFNTRLDGYYWVKFQNGIEVAEWRTDRWRICSSELDYCDKSITFIGEQIIPPDWAK